jgi:outer membrane protein assembly factor BamA
VSLDLGTDESTTDDFTTPRYEPAGLPLIGGNSDIGFQFGAAATLTRFDRGAKPYAWNMDLVLNTSIKGGSGDGIQFAQQNYVWNWDIPDLLDGKVRLNPVIYYQRTVDQVYFGLGDASSPAMPANAPRYFQYLDSELRARQLARIRLGGAYDLGLIGTFRAEAPTVYANSKLATDADTKNADGTPLLHGVLPGQGDNKMGIGMVGAGIIYDTRDNEVFPRSGAYHQAGLRAAEGFPLENNVQYGAAGANFTWMAPLDPHRAIVLAARLVADLEFGNVPFYDLFTGGTFNSMDMPGGPSGIRGVPSGRYLGRIKAIGNIELRSLPIAFHFLGQSFHLGGDLFFDTGRIWLDYTFKNPLDGTGLGLKYGTGAGIYALWGQAALFRVEVAYSPDQVAENPGFPVGIYVEDGLMF